MLSVRTYSCWIPKIGGHTSSITAKSAGEARAAKWRDAKESYPDLKIMDVKVLSNGRALTSVRFQEMADYRGVPFARVGMRVQVGDAKGFIVGHNSSANFDVRFDDDSKYRGQTLNCHPRSEITYFDDAHKVIASFSLSGAAS